MLGERFQDALILLVIMFINYFIVDVISKQVIILCQRLQVMLLEKSMKKAVKLKVCQVHL